MIRVNTDLVQTGVMVFDKQGRFVDGLERDQFELAVDGVPQSISFFGRVKAGTREEEIELAASRGDVAKTPAAARPLEETRRIIFFIDDLHLSLGSLERTRQMLRQYVDKDMKANDLVAIASTSGQLGFLQQFTDEKAVLRAAIKRLTHHPYNVGDMARESTPMTEYMALTIERKDDPGVYSFYVDECLRYAPPRYPRRSCEVEVINRARLILLQAASVISNTYESLQSLMRSSADLPGRKTVFFVSDGFLLDTGPRNADPRTKLNQIIDAAQRNGVVVYTIDGRGLTSNALDATNNVPVDMRGRLESASLREIPASQDALHGIAADTGGRALRNQNVFTPWINKILEETSNYYLLAWRPPTEVHANADLHNVKVTIVGRPDLTVRMARGFLRKSSGLAPTASTKSEPAKSASEELGQALSATYPRRELQPVLSLSYLDTPEHQGVLTASVQVNDAGLTFEMSGNKEGAVVDLAGVVVNSLGKSAKSFQTRLNITSAANETAGQRSTIYNYRAPLEPGLYQIRVAVRDKESGRVGGAMQWIEIPDLASRQLTLSSLLLGVQDVKAAGASDATSQLQFSVDHRFARKSPLRFVVFIYNLGSNNGVVQTQMLRDGKTVFTDSPRQINAAGRDPARVPYSAEIPLDTLEPGRYVLQVTATNSVTSAIAQQRATIIIE